MKQILSLMFLIISSLSSQSQSISWVFSGGGINIDEAYDVIVDNSGGSVFAGAFSDTATISGQTLISNGGADILIGRIDPSGVLSWLYNTGGTGNDGGHQLAIDAVGNIIIGGEFENSITMGSTTLTSQGGEDVFIAKLDNTGSVIWATSAGGPGRDQVNSIETNSNGDIYFTGRFTGSASFGPAAITGAGGEDIYISKLNPAGSFLWTSHAGGVENDVSRGLALNSNGDALITGYFSGTVNFGPFSFTSNNNSRDIFTTLLSSSGQFLWANKSGGPGNDGAYEVTVDLFDNFYIAGNFKNTGTFGPYILTSQGDDDIFISKINSNGFFLWANSSGGVLEDKAYALSIDNTGSLFVTGSFEGTATFDTQTLTSAGDRDVFMGSYDSNGALNFVLGAGGPGFDRGYGVAKSNGVAYVCGVFEQSASFENFNVTSNGATDLFVYKFDEPLNIDESQIIALSVFPNPCSNILHLNFKNTNAITSTLIIHDITGKQLIYENFVSSSDYDIDVSNLENGIYELTLLSNKGIYSDKLIINH